MYIYIYIYIYTVRCPKWAICALSGPPSFLNIFLYIYSMKIFCDFLLNLIYVATYSTWFYVNQHNIKVFVFFTNFFLKIWIKIHRAKTKKANAVIFYTVVVLIIVSSPCNWEKNWTNIDGAINHYTAGALTPSFLDWYWNRNIWWYLNIITI